MMVIDIRNTKSRKYHKYTEKDDEIIRIYYDRTKKSVYIIAGILNLSFDAVYARIARLRLLPSRKFWTKKEDELLAVYVEKYPIKIIARKLKKTQSAIESRVQTLKLSRNNKYGWYNRTEVADGFGVHHATVERWIRDGLLKAKRHNGRQKLKGSYWHINEKDLIEFIRRYPQELNGRRIDMTWFVDILVGIIVDYGD